jgi:hypothetical protein
MKHINNYERDLYELIGMSIGDGHLSKNKKYKEYALCGDIKEEKDYYEKHVKKIINKILGKPILKKELKPKYYEKTGVCGFYIFNEKVHDFLIKKGLKPGPKLNIEIPLKMINNKHINYLIRGLFDTDGSLYFEKNRTAKKPINKVPNIKLGSTSKKLILQIKNILVKKGYSPRIKKPHKGKRDKNEIHSILIYRKADILKWIKEIDFKNPKHKTKWKVFQKYGYCLPYSTIAHRKKILK